MQTSMQLNVHGHSKEHIVQRPFPSVSITTIIISIQGLLRVVASICATYGLVVATGYLNPWLPLSFPPSFIQIPERSESYLKLKVVVRPANIRIQQCSAGWLAQGIVILDEDEQGTSQSPRSYIYLKGPSQVQFSSISTLVEIK